MKFDIAGPWTRKQPPLGRAEVEQRTPTRAADLHSDLVVPLGQATVTGALTAALIVFLLSELAPTWGVNVWKVWIGLALAIAAVTWLVLLGQTRQLLWRLERLTGLDLDRDGTKGKPAERPILVNAARARAEAGKRQEAAGRGELAQFVARLPTRGTAGRDWESELGREQYEAFRDLLLELGWASWNSPRDRRQGWSLTVPVREILQRISDG